jgi:hypothetical protein
MAINTRLFLQAASPYGKKLIVLKLMTRECF